MYLTVRRYEGVSDTGEIARRVKDGFVPLVSGIPGFVAYYWVDAGNGVVITTGIFRDQAGAEESDRRSATWLQDNLASFSKSPPQITAGNIVAYKERKGAEAQRPAAAASTLENE